MVSTRKLRSSVWEYFDTVDAKRVCYKLCTPPTCTILAYHGKTTSMKSHLTSHHPNEYEETSQAKTGSQRSLDSFVHSKKCSTEHAKKITQRIAEMVAWDPRPISVVEGVGFLNLVSYLEPG